MEGVGRIWEEPGLGEAETVDQERKESSSTWQIVSFRAVSASHTYKSPGDLLKMQILSQQACSFCISNKLPGDAGATSLGLGARQESTVQSKSQS